MSTHKHITRKAALALMAALALSGCAAGPDFFAPKLPKGADYGQAAGQTAYAGGTVAGAAQAFARGGDVPSAWWMLYRSSALDNLMRRALAASPTVAAARANLEAAQEAALVARGGYLPTAGFVGNASRERSSGAPRGTSTQYAPFTLYNASVEISYSPDLFGGTRRVVEAATAAEAQQRALMRATYITLESNIVTAAVTEASLNGQIDATRKIVTLEKEQLAITMKQLALGSIDSSAVLAQRTALAQTEATLPLLEKQRAATENQLKALSGNFPNAAAVAHFNLTDLYLPKKLPVSLPSRLVEQRPDILAAEAQMHVASANIGIAAANMLPQVTLTGSYGLDANALEGFFSPSHIIWNAGLGLIQPFMPDPTLIHKKKEAEAQYRAAAAQYRATVVVAFQNVSDALNALQFDAEALKASVRAEKSAAASLDLERHRFHDGAVSYLSLLSAENAWQQTRLGLVKSEAARYADTAALFVALGGGWWNKHKDGIK